jgi:hypothetical protein
MISARLASIKLALCYLTSIDNKEVVSSCRPDPRDVNIQCLLQGLARIERVNRSVACDETRIIHPTSSYSPSLFSRVPEGIFLYPIRPY